MSNALSLDTLEGLARAATTVNGPRWVTAPAEREDNHPSWFRVWVECEGGGLTGLPGVVVAPHEIAEYIAACSPEVILSLLAALRESEAGRDEGERDVANACIAIAESVADSAGPTSQTYLTATRIADAIRALADGAPSASSRRSGESDAGLRAAAQEYVAAMDAMQTEASFGAWHRRLKTAEDALRRVLRPPSPTTTGDEEDA